MIFFKPVVDNENPSVVYFEAFENGVCCGKCKLIIDGDRAEAEITGCDKDKAYYIVDGLIKSAFNYACGKNCYMGYCKGSCFTDILDTMNFNKADGVYFNDIPSVLMGNCCKKRDNI